MERRNFIRIAGGGVVFAVTGGLVACAGSMPHEAVAAWQGPVGDGGDVRHWILAYAILAPHSHNLQSWLVDLSVPGDILLRCDQDRLLPETDPFSRQIMMSQGTFLELLDIAARERGLRAEVSLFPEGVFAPDKIDSRPVARIRLVPAPSVKGTRSSGRSSNAERIAACMRWTGPSPTWRGGPWQTLPVRELRVSDMWIRSKPGCCSGIGT